MSDLDPVILNFIYAILGTMLTIFSMWTGCKIFNRMFCFELSDELHKGNVAIGIMLAGMFIGIGVATGLVIGMGLN